MKFITAPVVVLVSALPSASLAWGNMGHEAVAYIASNFGKFHHGISNLKLIRCSVTSATKTYFQTILGDTTSDYLANVATYV